MANQPVPEAAKERLKQLYAAYAVSRRDLVCFTEGLLLGLGLDPDDWDLDTRTMTFHSQPLPPPVEVNNLEPQNQRRGV